MTTESTTPVAPAASLLFQAPVFQAAPEVAPPAIVEEPEPKHRRKSAASEEESAPREEGAPKRRRRSKKAADEAEAAQTPEAPATESESESEEVPAEPKTRRRRRSKKADEAAAPAQEEADKSDAPAQDSESSDEEETSGRRRRRRRARSSASSEESGDPADQVQALKGSTRLEAKKMRRREGRREGRRRHSISESEFLARRESVERTMVIRDQDGLDQIAILEDGLLVEHYVARRTQSSMVGNIYLGRVQNVLPSMEAAFVDVGRGRNAVLYAGEVNWDAVGMEGKPRRIEAALKSGDPVLVQVTKDPIGHKGARLTSQITLAGRYLVLIPGGSMMGISRKLPDKERARLKKILKAVVPSGSGVIVRTAAEGATEEQIRDDVARLTRQWEDIEKKRTNTKSAPTLLRGEPELAVRVVRDIFNEDFSKLVIEGRDTYATVKEYVDELSPELSDRVEQWVGTEDVFHAHRIDEQLAKGMDRKVWLPSGGTLIIDRTEAMTVIDVNTGRFTGAGGTLEETVTRNNLEAAEEIVRQLRLRDIGGMVVIDFVDMVLESNRDLVLRRLVECLGRDRTRHQVTEVTSLGLVQMTRKRVGQGLVEAFSTTCEHCKGRGFIVHDEPVENQQIDMSASASRGGGRSRGRKNREEQAAGGGKKETKQDSQETKGSKSSKGSGRGKASAGRDVAASPEPGADDEARAAVRGALAQIAAAAEQAHKDSQQEGQDPHEDQGAVEAPEAGVSDTADAAPQTAENGHPADGQDASDVPAEDKPVKSRSRKAADKKPAKKSSEKKSDKADKKSGRKTGKKAEKKAAATSEDPAEPQPGEAPSEPVEEKPVRRTRRRATAKSAAPSPENSSDTPEVSA